LAEVHAPRGGRETAFRQHGVERQRVDEVVGYRFALLARSNPAKPLTPDQLTFLADLDCRILSIGGDGSAEATQVSDLDGVYDAYLNDMDVFAMLTRPDTNLFGVARSSSQLGSLIEELKRKLHWLSPSGATRAA
jgi:hypothetical protein